MLKENREHRIPLLVMLVIPSKHLCVILQSSHDKLLERKAIQCQINNNSPGTKIKDELKIPSVNNFVPIQHYATFTEGGKIYNISSAAQAILRLGISKSRIVCIRF